MSSVPGSGRFLVEGNDNPLQYSCQGNYMDIGAWWAAVHEVTKSWTRLSDNTCICTSKMILISFKRVYIEEKWLCFIISHNFVNFSLCHVYKKWKKEIS